LPASPAFNPESVVFNVTGRSHATSWSTPRIAAEKLPAPAQSGIPIFVAQRPR
jgi:hypothetical protein